jgi:hypothetical protein
MLHRNQKVHYPMVKRIRQEVFGGEYDEDNIPPWLTAVSWCDGAAQELAALLHPKLEALDDKIGQRRMKHNKSRTYVHVMSTPCRDRSCRSVHRHQSQRTL